MSMYKGQGRAWGSLFCPGEAGLKVSVGTSGGRSTGKLGGGAVPGENPLD